MASYGNAFKWISSLHKRKIKDYHMHSIIGLTIMGRNPNSLKSK